MKFLFVALLFAIAAHAKGVVKKVRCESFNRKLKRCDVSRDGSGYVDPDSVRVGARHSKAACVLGTSFFYGKNEIIVTNGCRATILYSKIPTPPAVYYKYLPCSSIHFQPKTCNAGAFITQALVAEKLSDPAECIEGKTYSFKDKNLKVRDGCRAYFVVRVGDQQCIPSEKVVRVKNFTFDTNAATTALTNDLEVTAVTSDYFGENGSSRDQELGQIAISFSETQESTISFERGFSLTVGASVESGVPFAASATVSVEASASFSSGETQTRGKTLERSITSPPITVPAFSRIVARFFATMQKTNVPFTADVTIDDGCGQTREEKGTRGSVQITGIVNLIGNNMVLRTGPDVPIECESPEQVPWNDQLTHEFCKPINRSCSTNSICARFSTSSGNCCPNDNGQMLGCCSISDAHSSCEKKFGAGINVCPTLKGRFDSCCSDSSNKFRGVNHRANVSLVKRPITLK